MMNEDEYLGHGVEESWNDQDDGLSLSSEASSVSSTDTVKLAQRIAAAKRMLQKPAQHIIRENHRDKATPKVFSDSSSSSEEEEDIRQSFVARPTRQDNSSPLVVTNNTTTTAILGDISNTGEAKDDDDEWSKQPDNDANDGDSVDTTTLERRIFERRHGTALKLMAIPEDEFVLPDNDDSSTSSSSSDNNEVCDKTSQRCSIYRSAVQPITDDVSKISVTEIEKSTGSTHSNANQSKKANNDMIIPPEILAANDIRHGLHRPLPRSSVLTRPIVTTLQDEIEDSSEDEGPIRHRTVGRHQCDSSSRIVQRTSLPFVRHSTKKSENSKDKRNHRFSSGTKESPIRINQENDGSQSSLTRFVQSRQQYHETSDGTSRASVPPKKTVSQQGSFFIGQDRSSHSAGNASAYDAIPYQIPLVHHDDVFSPPKDHRAYSPCRNTIQAPTNQDQIIRTHPPIQDRQTSFEPKFDDRNRSRHHGQPTQMHRPDYSYMQDGPPYQDPQFNRGPPITNIQQVHKDPQTHQADFSIVAAAYEDVPFRPFVPQPDPRGQGRRIRDASVRPKRRGGGSGKRRKGRQPPKSRQKAPRTTTRSFFRRPRDDHLSGVGGASIQF